MKCKLKNRHELISDYLMGELPEDETRAFEEHYFHCEACFKELKIAEDAINIIAKDGKAIFKSAAHQPLAETESQSPEDKDSKIIIHKLIFPGLSLSKRWGIAATVAAVFIFFMIFTSRNDQEGLSDKTISDDKGSVTGEDTLKESQQKFRQEKDVFADLTGPAFEPEPYLEEWITENVRSDNDIIDTVFSPFVGEKFYNKEIIFKWKMNNDKPASFKILSNVEQEIFIATPKQSQSLISTIKVMPKVFKQSGIYYWRIEDENEVLYVGKFYFIQKP